jgi:hypothetical protein
MSTLVSRNDFEAFGQKVNDLAFALITPLRTYDDDNHNSWQFAVGSLQRAQSLLPTAH